MLYVRRQDEFLLSSWQEWYCKESSDFWAWLTRNVGMEGDWKQPLLEWEKVAPRSKTRVKVYDRQGLINGNVVDDFRSILRTDAALTSVQADVNRASTPAS